MGQQFATAQQLAVYRERHFIPDDDWAFSSFRKFFTARRQLILARLREAVGAAANIEDEIPVDDAGDSESVEKARFHSECIERVSTHLGTELKGSQGRYESQNSATRVICTVSKVYERREEQRFWFTFRPTHADFLSHAPNGYVCLGCGSADTTILLPWPTFEPFLRGMRTTEAEERMYWHVEVFRESGSLWLGLSVAGNRVDVSPFKL